MNIPGVTNTADNSVAKEATTRLSDNYDTFLVLLTAQLQNQDPLAPMDSTQFTQQLVQFSQVEQQIRTNEQLEGLVAQNQAASAGTALAYLGRDAIIEGNTSTLTGGAANWAYDLANAADNVKLKCATRAIALSSLSMASNPLANICLAGTAPIRWAKAPDGVYNLVITARDSAGTAVGVQTRVRETILGVDFTGDSPVVLTTSGKRNLDTIRAIID